jgi:hypothetical protein
VRLTPSLPEWAISFTDSQKTCTNIYELMPRETKLFGTEIFVDEYGVEETTWRYGDWDADLLLLAQDPANADKIEQRIAEGHPDPFCALDWRGFSDGMETNRNLHWLAQQIGCRKLYGSAYLGLLKSGKRGDAIPSSPEVKPHLRRTLEWVLEPKQTPNLRAIACLGIEARNLIIQVLKLDRAKAAALRQGVGSSIRTERFYVIHLMHPGRRNIGKGGCGPRAWSNWKKIAQECSFSILPPPWTWTGR